MYVFVYGTLKKDEPNHHWLADSTKGMARFVGKAKLANKYPLVIASKFNIPFLMDTTGHKVRPTEKLKVPESVPKLKNTTRNVCLIYF